MNRSLAECARLAAPYVSGYTGDDSVAIGHMIRLAAEAGHALDRGEARRLVREAAANGATGQPRKLPAPLGVSEILAVEEPEEEWLAEGLLSAGGNILLAGYPKTFKTMWLLELGVALASATSFLGRFKVPERRRVGIVLMEDMAHRVRRRLSRLCWGRAVDLRSLEGWLHFWFRPPLRLNDTTAVELAEYAVELDLDVLWVDSWSYVASGDSNSADEVTPQLQRLSSARSKRPGLTVGLTHHARKERGDSDGSRLTDAIRNSGAFGAWYDAGLVLARKGETSPVTVRAELRDYAAPDAFAFVVEDEDPASPQNGHRSGGWLRLRALDGSPAVVEREAAWQKLLPAVREFLAAHDGCSKRQLRDGIQGENALIEAAFEWLVATGEACFESPEKKGKAGRCHLLGADRAGPCRDRAAGTPAGDRADRAAPPIGGGHGTPSTPSGEGDRAVAHPGEPDRCAGGCGRPVGRPGVTCPDCTGGAP